MDKHPVWPRLMVNPNKWARNSDDVAKLINDWLSKQGLIN
jgi:hypothetical protein